MCSLLILGYVIYIKYSLITYLVHYYSLIILHLLLLIFTKIELINGFHNMKYFQNCFSINNNNKILFNQNGKTELYLFQGQSHPQMMTLVWLTGVGTP